MTTGSVTVFADVALTSHKRDADGYDFGYKDMSEDMGPCQAQCPKGILDLLTSPSNDYARDWRVRCRAQIATQTAARARPALIDGQKIRLAAPITFSDGAALDTFIVVYRPGARPRLAFRSDAGGLYRIENVQSRDYQVVDTTP